VPENRFRYVPKDRAPAWEALGWIIISAEPLLWPQGEFGTGTWVVIMEWLGRGDPVVPEDVVAGGA
jgi:hypothetical protein